jgi:hypothetical protein
VRLYSSSREETLRARRLLKEWIDEALLTQEQYQRLEQETVSDLRTTNVSLRLVLFFFTLIIVGAAVALFFEVFLSRSWGATGGVFLLIFSAVCYVASEVAVSQGRIYRFGIEEALAVCSVGFLCFGMQEAFFSGRVYPTTSYATESLVPAAGAMLSLWIWRRFGFWYAFPAAMIFTAFLPGYWTPNHAAHHIFIATFYGVGLVSVIAIRSHHRFDYLRDTYSLAEALLWLGIYLAFNLKLSSLGSPATWRIGDTWSSFEFSRLFYWTTWVLIWCLPPVVLARGIRQKERFVIAVGAIAAILTLVSNKPYLGWQRHTWDPMLLGVLLTAVALFLQRWLSSGAGGVRHGFTALRVSGKEKHWMNLGAAVTGLMTPQSITPAPHPSSPDPYFSGGQTGGGGAGGQF